MIGDQDRVSLGYFPTPIDRLERLTRHLGGPQILIKRDDMTGLATGGNKTRKLEYLIADALRLGAHTVITMGAPQSNHARQTAAAAARYGLGCVLVLRGMAPSVTTGNLLLDRLLGARLCWSGDRDPYTVMQEVAREEEAAGRTPYLIPYGGSNAIGAVGYVRAMDEVVRQALEQDIRIDYVVVASGSGGTQAGMVAGARALNFRGRILGVSIDKSADLFGGLILDLARLTMAHLNLRLDIDPQTVCVKDAYLGEGYGIMSDAEVEAVRLLARIEGILLDPVYTSRAMAGLLDMIERGEIGKGETVLFWHTGGTPALHAYAERLA